MTHGFDLSLQTKCVRYYMNFERALELMRSILQREGKAFDANNADGAQFFLSFCFNCLWASSTHKNQV